MPLHPADRETRSGSQVPADASKVSVDLLQVNILASVLERQANSFLADYGLTLPQLNVLMAVVNGCGTLREVATHIDCSPGNLTGIVDRLERDDWLQRKRSRTDRRIVLVTPTARGEGVTSIRQALVLHLQALMADLSQQDATCFMQCLSAIAGRLEAMRGTEAK